MKTKTLYPIAAAVLALALASTACAVGATPPEPTATLPPTVPPTETAIPVTATPVPPTNTPVPPTKTPLPSKTPTPEPQPFYTDDFSDNIDAWFSVVLHGDENKAKADIQDGYLVFDITAKDTYLYLFNAKFTYTDVRIVTQAENRGLNNNNVSLLCRASDGGWYEFNIANNGLYWIYAYIVKKGYVELASGGSNAIKMGKDVNEYAAECVGNQLTLYINGVETKSVTDNQYKLEEGWVGLSVSSFNVFPIVVGFDLLEISEP